MSAKAPCVVCGIPVIIGDGGHWFNSPVEQRLAELLHRKAGDLEVEIRRMRTWI